MPRQVCDDTLNLDHSSRNDPSSNIILRNILCIMADRADAKCDERKVRCGYTQRRETSNGEEQPRDKREQSDGKSSMPPYWYVPSKDNSCHEWNAEFDCRTVPKRVHCLPYF